MSIAHHSAVCPFNVSQDANKEKKDEEFYFGGVRRSRCIVRDSRYGFGTMWLRWRLLRRFWNQHWLQQLWSKNIV